MLSGTEGPFSPDAERTLIVGTDLACATGKQGLCNLWFVTNRDKDHQFEVFTGNRLQRFGRMHVKLSGQPAVESVLGTIEIGMGTEHRNAGLHCLPEGLANRIVRSQTLDRTEQQGMMRDQGLSPGITGRLNGRQRGVQ